MAKVTRPARISLGEALIFWHWLLFFVLHLHGVFWGSGFLFFVLHITAHLISSIFWTGFRVLLSGAGEFLACFFVFHVTKVR
jgi:hypothetical protein